MTYPSFSAGDVLTATDMNAVGLWLVKAESAVTATNASPKGVQSVFTSDYRNYRLVWFASQATANASFDIQFYSGTNTAETASVYVNYWGGNYTSGGPTYNYGSYFASDPNTKNTYLYSGATIGSGQTANGWLDIYQPQISNVHTRFMGQSFVIYTGTYYNTNLSGSGAIETNTQYTGFRFIPSAGTATITYRLYGYRD